MENVNILKSPIGNFLILGHAGHGKDTVAKLMCEKLDIPYKSTSSYIGQNIVWKNWGVGIYSNIQLMLENKDQDRIQWYNTLLNYSGGKSKLAREVLTSYTPYYIGMRSIREFEKCIKDNLFDYVIWVDRSGSCKSESSNSMTITKEDIPNKLLHTIYNNSDLIDLKDKVYGLVENLKIDYLKPKENTNIWVSKGEFGSVTELQINHTIEHTHRTLVEYKEIIDKDTPCLFWDVTSGGSEINHVVDGLLSVGISKNNIAYASKTSRAYVYTNCIPISEDWINILKGTSK